MGRNKVVRTVLSLGPARKERTLGSNIHSG
jgi:hypothetical protein